MKIIERLTLYHPFLNCIAFRLTTLVGQLLPIVL